MSSFDYTRRVNNYPEKGEGYFIALENANLKKPESKQEAVDQQELFDRLNPHLKKGDG